MIYQGVNKGIENTAKIIMPILILFVIAIAIFSLTLTHTDDDGTVRTGLQGLAVYVIPDFGTITLRTFFITLLDAMGQLFFSLSVAMGIMVSYGSYMKDDAHLGDAVNKIEIFDTAIALLAGVMIVPAVYCFMGSEGLSASGPGLMFISLPKVFAAMGKAGVFVGCAFFVLVLFAAITSAVSIMEAVVSSLMDFFKISRAKATIIEAIFALVLGTVVCLGYNVFYFELELPNGSVAQILDLFDYVSNNCLMPAVALSICILVGWVLKPDVIIEEAEKTGKKLSRKRLYVIMLRYIAPVLLLLLLLEAVAIL